MTDDENPPNDEPEPPPAPTSAGDAELREAVGVSAPAPAPKGKPIETPAALLDDAPEPEPEDEEGPPKKRGKLGLVVAATLIAGGTIATFVLLGRANSARYVFQCGAQRITAERGRSFPPWGSNGLDGAEWKPIAIPPETECQSRETDKRAELEQWYLDALVEQAQEKLTAKDGAAVDDAEAQLQQALLLARDPDKRDQRKDIDRLLGDVEYWRGAARVKTAADTLEDAAKLFDSANDKRPRHASDAAAWAEYAREIEEKLKSGPGGPSQTPAAASASPPSQAPTGVALPVEEPDAGVEAPPPPDAGVPRGGVLL